MIDKRRSIGVAAKEVGLQEHVMRFWETQFPDTIKPTIGVGGRRYYYDKDIKILLEIKKYLYEDKYSIKGLQELLRERNLGKINATSVTNNFNINNQQNEFNCHQNYINSNQINYLNQQNVIQNTLKNEELKNKLFKFKEHLMDFLIKLEDM